MTGCSEESLREERAVEAEFVMNKDAVKLGEIDFKTAAPSLRLLETLRIAFSLPCLTVSFLATAFLEFIRPGFPELPPELPLIASSGGLPTLILSIGSDAEHFLVKGLSSGSVVLRLVICLMILGFSGCAIGRAAGFAFCRQSRAGALRSIRWSAVSWRPVLVSTCLLSLAVLTGMLLVRFSAAVSGWLSFSETLSTVGQFFMWSATVAFLLCGMVASIGWLLSLSALSLDDNDGAEALSRGISYVLSDFWRTLCYGIAVLALAGIGAELTSLVLSVAGHLASILQGASMLQGLSPSESPGGTTTMQAFSDVVTETVRLSICLTGSTVSYVLLRLFVDNVQVSEAALAATSALPKTNSLKPSDGPPKADC